MIAVDGVTHSQRDGVGGNGGSLKDGAEAFVLFLRGAQLVLRSSVLTVLDLDEVNVTLENTETFGSVLSGKGGSAGGGWRTTNITTLKIWNTAYCAMPAISDRSNCTLIGPIVRACVCMTMHYSLCGRGPG